MTRQGQNFFEPQVQTSKNDSSKIQPNQTDNQNTVDTSRDGKGKPSQVPRRKILFTVQKENKESAADTSPTDFANLTSPAKLSRQQPLAHSANSEEVEVKHAVNFK